MYGPTAVSKSIQIGEEAFGFIEASLRKAMSAMGIEDSTIPAVHGPTLYKTMRVHIFSDPKTVK